MLTKKSNHQNEALSRLVSQFKDKANMSALLDAYIAQVQNLEEVFFDLLQGRIDIVELKSGTSTAVGAGFLDDSAGAFVPGAFVDSYLEDSSGVRVKIVSNTVSRIYTANGATPASGAYAVARTTGTQLDLAGTILNIGREGRGDSSFRDAIQNQIRSQSSHGTIEDLITIVKNSSGYVGSSDITVTEFYPAEFYIYGDGMLWDTAVNALKAFALVKNSKPAGVRMTFSYAVGAAPFFTTDTGVGGGFDNASGTEPTAGQFVGVLIG